MKRTYRVCSRCLMDTSVASIRFDPDGICQFCRIHDALEPVYPLGDRGQQVLKGIFERIRRDGRGKSYDCVIGVSGGRDSSYTLYLAVKMGLRPLAVHFDSGWNTDIAVTNIRNFCQRLDVDLETVVAEWDEFRDLQVSFLKASVPDMDIPTDIAISGVLHEIAAKEGLQYIVEGYSFRTEGMAPIDWTYMDARYLADIQRRFGSRPLRHYRNFGIRDLLYYTFVKKIKTISPLNYVSYVHEEIEGILEKELDWSFYGEHHHENNYTKFTQSYLLPKKFGIDRRRTELSALVRSGHRTRAEAMAYLDETPYEYDEDLVDYVIDKLELTREEFDRILALPVRSFRDYSTYYPFFRLARFPIWVASRLGVIPNELYLKFLGN